MTIFTRSQIETTIAALLATATAMIGLAHRSDREVFYGPKFLALERVGRFTDPVHIAQPGGNLLAVVERAGRIRIFRDGDPAHQKTFLDLRARVKHIGEGGEQGMLSVAFAPDYPRSHRFYVSFTDRRNALRVVEFRRAPDSPMRALRGSAREVIRIPEPSTKHHSGYLLFGPDRLLYVGSGDGGPSGDPNNVAQNPNSLLGKILRIDPRKRGRKPYTIPKDNPYVGRRGRDEVFARGLRNPWRFAFDPGSGGFAVGDVGQDRFEEVDYVPSAGKLRGANFGWSAFEGFAPFKGGLSRRAIVAPALAYRHGPGCSVTGGPFVADSSLDRIAGPEIFGAYLFGDYCSGNIFAIRPHPGKRAKERRLRFRVPLLSSFGTDLANRIYVTSQDGPVFRIVGRRKQIG